MLYFSTKDPVKVSEMIAVMRHRYGVRLNDGWNGGFGQESNLTEDRRTKT